jgi:hypothetical protein
VVAPNVIDDAIEMGQLLAGLGIPHALVGGLAVGLNGHPRATKDVDYLVGREAFEITALAANRTQDRDDVERLIAAGADEGRLAAYIAENAPQLLSRFSEIVG